MQEGVFDVYTDVAAHMTWINDTILSMGGMQSCGYTLEKILSEDEGGDYAVDNVGCGCSCDGGVVAVGAVSAPADNAAVAEAEVAGVVK